MLGQFETSGPGGQGGQGGQAPGCQQSSDCPLGNDRDADCAKAECIEGVCAITDLAKNTACGVPGQRCDGLGHCVDCLVDGDCGKGSCLDGTCDEKEPGKPCVNVKECASGFCAGGVCCQTACTGACESCAELGHEGSCTFAEAGSSGLPICPGYVCNGSNGACPSNCALDTDCVAGRFCELTSKTCELKKPNGDSCVGDGMCQNGDCYKNKCCNSGCQCGSCATGTCVVTPGNPGPGTDPGMECGVAGTCDGLTGCTTKGALVYAFGADTLVVPGAGIQPFDVASDSSGNTIVVGEFFGSVGIGKATFVAKGNSDGFVLKLDPTGQLIWFTALSQEEALGSQSVRALTIDKDGTIFIAGSFKGSLTLNAKALGLTSVTAIRDMFLMSLNADGGVLAASAFKGATTTSDVVPVGIEALGSGAVIVAGNFVGAVDFVPMLTSTANGGDGFILTTDAKLTGVAMVRVGGAKLDQIDAMAAGAKGEVLVAGSFNSVAGDNFKVTNQELVSAGDLDIFIARYAFDTKVIAGKVAATYGSTGIDRARGIARDAAGIIYVTGSKTLGVSFSGASTAPTAGQNGDPFLVALTNDFAHVWTQSNGTLSADTGRAVVVDSKGLVVAGGDFASTLTLKLGLSLTSPTSTPDPFIAKLFPGAMGGFLGTPIFGLAFSGSGFDNLVALTTTLAERDIVAVGNYTSNMTIGNVTLPTAGTKNPSMFVVRLQQ